MVVHTRWWAGDFTVIRRRIEIDHFQRCLQKVDAWNEGLSLDTVLVQFIRVSVGCCYEDNPMGHKRLEKSKEDE